MCISVVSVFALLIVSQMKIRQRPFVTMRRFIRATTVLVCVWLTSVAMFWRLIMPKSVTTGPGLVPGQMDFVLSSLQQKDVQKNLTVTVTTRAVKPEKDVLVLKVAKNFTGEEHVLESSDNARVKKKKIFFAIDTPFRPPDTDLERVQNEKVSVIHMKREAAEKRYYTLGTTKVNPISHELIISGGQICDAKSPFLLIMIPSIPAHYSVRNVIRNTYGSFSRDRSTFHKNTNYSLNETVKIMFLVGRDGRENSDTLIRNESRTHGDIVQADFKESYHNLTRKMLIALRWTAMYCSEIDFFLKADEDVFVNVPLLVRTLKRKPYSIKGAIYGHINKRSSVKRTGKWEVGWKEFPLLFYPTYASGNSYVISGNIVPRMFMVSEYYPYMPIEDAFVTGILARVVEANHVNVQGFTYWEDVEPDPCGFVRNKRISATKVTEELMQKLWKASQEFDKYCRYNLNPFH